MKYIFSLFIFLFSFHLLHSQIPGFKGKRLLVEVQPSIQLLLPCIHTRAEYVISRHLGLSQSIGFVALPGMKGVEEINGEYINYYYNLYNFPLTTELRYYAPFTNPHLGFGMAPLGFYLSSAFRLIPGIISYPRPSPISFRARNAMLIGGGMGFGERNMIGSKITFDYGFSFSYHVRASGNDFYDYDFQNNNAVLMLYHGYLGFGFFIK